MRDGSNVATLLHCADTRQSPGPAGGVDAQRWRSRWFNGDQETSTLAKRRMLA